MNALKRTLALIAVLLYSVCYTLGASAQSTDDMLTQYMTVTNANLPPNLNAEVLANLFSVEAVQGHKIGAPPNLKNPMRGREEIKVFYSGFDEVFADWAHIETKRTVEGRHAVWEGTAKGTHKDSGKSLEIPIAFSITFNDEGAVVAMDVYFNSSLMADQLK